MRSTWAAILFVAISSSCAKSDTPPFRPDLTEVDESPKTTLPFFSGADMNPVWNARSPAALRRLATFELQSSEEKTVTHKIASGQFVIASFFYSTCAGICPTLINNLKGLIPTAEGTNDVLMVSFSIDPLSDSPKKIQAYLHERGIRSKRWLFLTGDRSELFRVARDTFNADTLVNTQQLPSDFVHSENVFLLDRAGFVRAIYRGRGPAAVSMIIKDIERLRSEPSPPHSGLQTAISIGND